MEQRREQAKKHRVCPGQSDESFEIVEKIAEEILQIHKEEMRKNEQKQKLGKGKDNSYDIEVNEDGT